MKVGDLVRVMSREGNIGLIVKIEEYYLMAQKAKHALLHTGESFRLHELEVV